MIKQDWYRKPEGVKTRWASPENVWGRKGQGGKSALGRKGSPYFFLQAGKRLTLAEATGTSGVIRRIWMTIHDLCPRILKQLRLEIYWDGAKKPAVNVPLGDFFCMGLGRMTAFESACFSSPEGRSLNCFLPMPFRTGMRVELVNDGFSTANMIYYDINYTLGDDIPDDAMYLHAWYNQELPTVQREDYTILAKVSGKGRFLGANFGVFMDQKKYHKSWGGEGEVKFYLDGDEEYPTLCGTGTEDYVGTGWCQGQYSNQYQGFTVADDDDMALCFYRFHIPDPIYFDRDIRVTIQQIGSWNRNLIEYFKENDISVIRAGMYAQEDMKPIDLHKESLPDFDLFERSDFWSSCCYFYLDQPENDLPVITDVKERVKSIPGFEEKELYDLKNEMYEVQMISKYIPDFKNLSLEEIRQLQLALQVVERVMSNQEQAMKKE